MWWDGVRSAHGTTSQGIYNDQTFFALAVSQLWAGAVCVSRVLLGRHHVGDVLAGVVVGYVNYELVRYLWLEREQVMELRAEMLVLLATAGDAARAYVQGHPPTEAPKAEL